MNPAPALDPALLAKARHLHKGALAQARQLPAPRTRLRFPFAPGTTLVDHLQASALRADELAAAGRCPDVSLAAVLLSGLGAVHLAATPPQEFSAAKRYARRQVTLELARAAGFGFPVDALVDRHCYFHAFLRFDPAETINRLERDVRAGAEKKGVFDPGRTVELDDFWGWLEPVLEANGVLHVPSERDSCRREMAEVRFRTKLYQVARSTLACAR